METTTNIRYILAISLLLILGHVIAMGEYIDSTVRAQDDLFKYVNGKWNQNQCGIRKESDKVLTNKINVCLNNIIKNKNPTTKTISLYKNSDENPTSAIVALYKSLQDKTQVLSTIQYEFKAIDDINSKDQIPALLGRLNKIGVAAFVDFINYPDPSNSNLITAFTAWSQKIGRQPPSANYIRSLFTYAGTPIEDERVIQAIIEINKKERLIASLGSGKPFLTRFVGLTNTTNPLPRQWHSYFEASQLGKHAQFVKYDYSYFDILNLNLSQTNITLVDLKAYLKFKLLDTYKDFLYYNSIPSSKLPSLKAISTEDMAAFKVISDSFSYDIPKLCFGYYLDGNKLAIEKIVTNLTNAYHDSINNSAWMSNDTKILAHTRLSELKIITSYPEFSDTMPASKIALNNPMQSLIAINLYYSQLKINDLGKPSNLIDMENNMLSGKLYYNKVSHKIFVPLRLLTPPYLQAEVPLNYGGFGAALGHEISHALEPVKMVKDTGSWMNASETRYFDNVSKQLIMQYQGLPSYYDNPDIIEYIDSPTAMEDMADNRGLLAANIALNKLLSPQLTQEQWKKINQAFFINFAETWREKADCSANSNYSTPSERVNKTAQNLEAFYTAFDVEPGNDKKPPDKMYLSPKERVKVW